MILTTIWTLPCLHVSVRVEKILPPYYLKLIKVNILSVMAIFLLFTTIYIEEKLDFKCVSYLFN